MARKQLIIGIMAVFFVFLAAVWAVGSNRGTAVTREPTKSTITPIAPTPKTEHAADAENVQVHLQSLPGVSARPTPASQLVEPTDAPAAK